MSKELLPLKNGEVIEGEVANIKHGFNDELLDKIRIKATGKRRAKKYHPWQIKEYTMGERRFVSLRVQRNNSVFQEKYLLNSGNEYKIFELYREGHLSIYLEYFSDDNSWIQTVPFFMKKDEELLVRATQGVFGLKRKLLADYFRDCPELVELIEEKKITTPEEVVIYYNDWVENKLNPQ